MSKMIKRKNDKNNLLLVVKNLSKNFGHKKKILKDISFNLQRNEVLAIVGANGAGKTVLVETLVGLNNLTSGKIFWNLKNNEEFGIQFQDAEFPKRNKVYEIIYLFEKIYKDILTFDEIKDMINAFGINDFIDSKVKALSGGQKQRLNLLLALINKPVVLILDEFITGLDIVAGMKIIEHIKKIREKNGMAMIMISHQSEEVAKMADRVILLKGGTITMELTKGEVLNKYESFSDFMVKEI